MYFVDIMDKMLTSFLGPQDGVDSNDFGTTDNRPRFLEGLGIDNLGQIIQFAKTLYNLL